MAEVLVVKVGGGEGIPLGPVCGDLAGLASAGRRLVLVHGASHQTDLLSRRLGIEPRHLVSPGGFSSRYTDRASLEVFVLASVGRVNKDLVVELQRRGVRAVGLSGLDGGLLTGERKRALRSVENGRVKVVRDDMSGRVTEVNAGLLQLLLDAGYLPVVGPPALDPQDGPINVDSDRAAAAVAAALRASCLLILTNVPGLLADPDDPATLVARVGPADMERCLDYARGRMKRKLLGAREALEGGVGRVVLADARKDHPVLDGLAGAGTVIEGGWAGLDAEAG